MIDLCKKCNAWDNTHERLKHLPELAEMGILTREFAASPGPELFGLSMYLWAYS